MSGGVAGDGGLFIHASAAVVAEAGVIVRGASGTGKTSLVLALVAEARSSHRFARLVADDRVGLSAHGGRLVARPHPRIAGLVEQRGLGIEPAPYEPACVVRLVVDLVAVNEAPPARMPTEADARVDIAGVVLPRLRVPSGVPVREAAQLVLHRLGRDAPGSVPQFAC